ncbi:MAG: SPOR domain-containing protein [Bacteroidales bacterium]|nr:SPOR domain-containing protein [Bacteroidales bacterium]
MKKNDILILLMLIFSIFPMVASAQQNETSAGYVYVDSVVFRPTPGVDSSLVGKNIFQVLSAEGGRVAISQTPEVEGSMKKHIVSNGGRTLPGYRVRIFFDNRQSARVASEEAVMKFQNIYHGVSVYRTYVNPYFKVTVGDFRTRSEAMALLTRIKREFPSAFVVKEGINYPIVDKDNAYVVDTVKVCRPVSVVQH